MDAPNATADIGLIGLAVMGENLVLNMESHGYTVAVFNRTTVQGRRLRRRPRPRARRSSAPLARGARRRAEAAAQDHDAWSRPGRPVDEVIDELAPAARAGRHPHRRRQLALSPTPPAAPRRSKEKGLLFIGTGVSGGEEGALQGPVDHARRQPRRLAARQADLPGHRRQGRRRRRPAATGSAPKGAGHYVKMVHNGIEYGDMQLICEAYHLLKDAARPDAPTSCTRSSPSGTRASSTAT